MFCAVQDGALGIVWAPTQDGIFYSLKTEVFLTETPDDLRRQGLFERVPAIIGINSMDGAALASISCYFIIVCMSCKWR